jgi:hypothetical protein
MLVVRVIDGHHLRVIHYTTNDEKNSIELGVAAVCPLLGSAGEVKEEDIAVDLSKENYHQLDYPPGVAVYTGMDVVDRARLKLKEKKYSGFSNNCESLVNWAITTKESTNQGDNAAGALLVLAVLGTIASAVMFMLKK